MVNKTKTKTLFRFKVTMNLKFNKLQQYAKSGFAVY